MDVRQADTPWMLRSRMSFEELQAMRDELLWDLGLWRVDRHGKGYRPPLVGLERRLVRGEAGAGQARGVLSANVPERAPWGHSKRRRVALR